jgi:hypothetical protein
MVHPIELTAAEAEVEYGTDLVVGIPGRRAEPDEKQRQLITEQPGGMYIVKEEEDDEQ